MLNVNLLNAEIKAVCPVHGVDSAGGISFCDGATDAQRAAAQAVVDYYLSGSGQVDVARVEQIAIINDATESALRAIVSSYPALEIATWPNQYHESVAYTANSLAQTPTLTAIAAASGKTVADMATSVLTKAAAYTAASGAVVGKRQALTAQIIAATTVDEVKSVIW